MEIVVFLVQTLIYKYILTLWKFYCIMIEQQLNTLYVNKKRSYSTRLFPSFIWYPNFLRPKNWMTSSMGYFGPGNVCAAVCSSQWTIGPRRQNARLLIRRVEKWTRTADRVGGEGEGMKKKTISIFSNTKSKRTTERHYRYMWKQNEQWRITSRYRIECKRVEAVDADSVVQSEKNLKKLAGII